MISKSMTEIMEHLGLKHRYNVKHRYIDPLIEGCGLDMTIPKNLIAEAKNTNEH